MINYFFMEFNGTATHFISKVIVDVSISIILLNMQSSALVKRERGMQNKLVGFGVALIQT